MSDAPVFLETRVPIQNLFEYIEGEEDLSEFLDDFSPSTSDVDIIVDFSKPIGFEEWINQLTEKNSIPVEGDAKNTPKYEPN